MAGKPCDQWKSHLNLYLLILWLLGFGVYHFVTHFEFLKLYLHFLCQRPLSLRSFGQDVKHIFSEPLVNVYGILADCLCILSCKFWATLPISLSYFSENDIHDLSTRRWKSPEAHLANF